MGAGIEEFGDIEFGAALQAAVDHLPGGGGDEVGPDVVGELFGFHSPPDYSVCQNLAITDSKSPFSQGDFQEFASSPL